MRVILVPGHGPKGDRYDPGAACDLDGDGRTDPLETEALMVRDYAGRLERAMREHGWETAILAEGGYAERAREARRIAERGGRTAILYCHINSYEGPARGLVGYLARSRCGARLADCLAEGLAGCLPSAVREVSVRGYVPDEAERWARHGYAVLRPSWTTPAGCCGALIEPWPIQILRGHLDDRDDWLAATAHGLEVGLLAWAMLAWAGA